MASKPVSVLKRLLAVGFLSLTLASGWLAHLELQAVGFARLPDLQALARGVQPQLALSAAADQALLDGCLLAARSVEGRLLTGEPRKSLQKTCLRTSEAITRRAPAGAYAWFVVATFRREAGDIAGFNQALERSYGAGAYVQWIAALRVELAERHLADMRSAVHQHHRVDLALLVQSPRGAALLARRYVADQGFRTRISAVVAGLPEAQQRAFIYALRAGVVNG